MRQVLSWRFVVAIAAVAVAALAIRALFADTGGPVASIAEARTVTERRPELVELVLSTEGAPFAITVTGQASSDLLLTMADGRQLRIFAGTPGESTCPDVTAFGACALIAELLGDSISWFALVPLLPSFRFEVPAIDRLDGGLAHLVNGWAFRYARVIDRSRCPSDAESFGEFLRLVGPNHRALFDLGTERIVAVTCT